MKKSFAIFPVIALLSLASCGVNNVEVTGDAKKAVMTDVVDAYSNGEVALPASKNYGLNIKASTDAEVSVSNISADNIDKTTSETDMTGKVSLNIDSALALILDGDSHSLGENTSLDGSAELSTSHLYTPAEGDAETSSGGAKVSGKIISKGEFSDKLYSVNDVNGSLTMGNSETTYKDTVALHQDEISLDTQVAALLKQYDITDLSEYKIPGLNVSEDMKAEISSVMEGTDETFNKYFTLGLYTQGENYIISLSANKDAIKTYSGKNLATEDETKDEAYSLAKCLLSVNDDETFVLNSLKYTIADSFKLNFSLTLNKNYLPIGLTYDINLTGASLAADYNLAYSMKIGEDTTLIYDTKRTQEVKATKFVSSLSAELKFGTDVQAILMTDDEKKQAEAGETFEEFFSSNAPKQ